MQKRLEGILNDSKSMLEQFINEMSLKGFSDVEKLKNLNLYFKTWDGVKVDELASYNEGIFIEFILDNSEKMSELEEVDLWGFPSDKLEQILSGKRNLKKINKTQGKYPFPKSILLNKDLVELNLTLTPLKKIPKAIGELKSLRKIDFAQTDIQELPEELGELEELREIIIYPKLKKIHTSITNNMNLINIDLGSNKITDIPEGIFELKNLESLDLSGNPIETFNFQLAKWPRLKRLDISRTPFGIYRNNVELLKKMFPNAEIIGGSNDQFIGDNKFGIYLNCTKTTYK